MSPRGDPTSSSAFHLKAFVRAGMALGPPEVPTAQAAAGSLTRLTTACCWHSGFSLGLSSTSRVFGFLDMQKVKSTSSLWAHTIGQALLRHVSMCCTQKSLSKALWAARGGCCDWYVAEMSHPWHLLCKMLTTCFFFASLSPEFPGGWDPTLPQPENNHSRPSQLLCLQREEEEKPVPAFHLPSCQW
jgi:hypothetical protein